MGDGAKVQQCEGFVGEVADGAGRGQGALEDFACFDVASKAMQGEADVDAREDGLGFKTLLFGKCQVVEEGCDSGCVGLSRVHDLAEGIFDPQSKRRRRTRSGVQGPFGECVGPVEV